MLNLKKETIKKNIFLILSIISAFIFIAGVMCTIIGDNSPVKFIVNKSLVKQILPSMLVLLVTFALYRKSKKAIKKIQSNC